MANEDQYDRKQRVLWFLLLLSGGSVLITALMRRNELAALKRGHSDDDTHARAAVNTTQPSSFREVTPQAAWDDFGARKATSRNDHTKPDSGSLAQDVAASVPGDGGDSCPPDYPVKGSRSRIYYLPDQNNYSTTRPSRCFTTVEAAEAAGFRARKS